MFKLALTISIASVLSIVWVKAIYGNNDNNIMIFVFIFIRFAFVKYIYDENPFIVII